MAKRITVQFAVSDTVDAERIRESLSRGIYTGFNEVSLLAVNTNIDEIAKEVRVCPCCGSESFNAVRTVSQRYYCNSEGLPFSIVHEVWQGETEEASRPDSMQCSVCSKSIHPWEAVPEWFFHNVICNEDWDDTAMIVVPDYGVEEVEEILALNEPSFGWDEGRVIEIRETEFSGGDYRVEMKLINSNPPTVDIEVSHKGQQVAFIQGSRQYFGEFEFHLKDQLTQNGDVFDRNFKLIVMSESDLKNLEQPENIAVTDGNTNGNEEGDELQ